VLKALVNRLAVSIVLLLALLQPARAAPACSRCSSLLCCQCCVRDRARARALVAHFTTARRTKLQASQDRSFMQANAFLFCNRLLAICLDGVGVHAPRKPRPWPSTEEAGVTADSEGIDRWSLHFYLVVASLAVGQPATARVTRVERFPARQQDASGVSRCRP